MRTILNTALSYVRSVSLLQFSEHFQFKFDNSNVNNYKHIKQKMADFFFVKLSTFSALSFWEKPLWNQRLLLLTAIDRQFLLHSTQTFSNVELFSIVSQTFFELIFATKMKTMLLKQSDVLFKTVAKRILRIYWLHIAYVWTLKIFCTNKRILTWIGLNW